MIVLSTCIVVAVVIGVACLYVWRTKSRKGAPVPGYFDFGRHKASEMSKRGLFGNLKR